jgi:hypothetical protein
MNHSYESRPTFYNGVLFRTRLEARWACFFDLAAWKWDYEPIDLVGWTPTFRVEFPCSHTECAGSHVLLVDVKPFYHLSEFTGLRCMDFPFGIYEKPDGSIETIPADASAAFGIHPDVSQWDMSHGAGGGTESVKGWIYGDVHELWNTAGNILRGLTDTPAFQGPSQSLSIATVAITGAGQEVVPMCNRTRPWANRGHTCVCASLALSIRCKCPNGSSAALKRF